MTVGVFRKKPVEVAAIRNDGDPARFTAWAKGIGVDPAIVEFAADGTADIATLEGTVRADVGDWIIRGVKGELYPCKPDIFTQTYDLVEGATSPVPGGFKKADP